MESQSRKPEALNAEESTQSMHFSNQSYPWRASRNHRKTTEEGERYRNLNATAKPGDGDPNSFQNGAALRFIRLLMDMKGVQGDLAGISLFSFSFFFSGFGSLWRVEKSASMSGIRTLVEKVVGRVVHIYHCWRCHAILVSSVISNDI